MNTAILVVLSFLVALAASKSTGICAGCSYDINTESKEIRDLLTSTFNQVNSNIKLVDVKKCRGQIVAGEKIDCQLVIKNNDYDRVCDFGFLIQPWMPSGLKVYRNTCINDDQLPLNEFYGEAEDISVDSPLITELAGFVSQQVTLRTNAEVFMKVIKIVSAKRQIVAGDKYFLKVLLATTNCDSSVNDDSKCIPFPYAHQMCDVTVLEQPWNNIKEVTSLRCQKIYGNVEAVKVGGIEDIPVDSTAVQQLGDFVSQQVTLRTNAEVFMKVIKTVSAKRQLVAGEKYFLKVLLATTDCDSSVSDKSKCKPFPYAHQMCDVTVFQQPWNNIKEVTSLRCQKIYGNVEAVKVGGIEDIPVDSTAVQQLGDFVSQQVTLRTNAEVFMKVIKTVSAKRQLVAGEKYFLRVLLATTNCDSSASDYSKCIPSSNANQMCDVTVFEQSWNNIKVVTSLQCQKINGGIEGLKAGAPEVIPVDSPDVQQLTDFVSHRVTVMTNANSYMKIIKTVSAMRQHVAGMNYFLQVLLAKTNCDSEVDDATNCVPQANAYEICDITVFEQSWSNIREVTHLDCQKLNQETEATVVGGITDIPVDRSVVTQLGDFVSQEMTVKTNAEVYMKVIKTISAKQQVVSGVLYYLDVLLAPTNCGNDVQDGSHCIANKHAIQQCQVTVFRQVWNNINEVTHFQCHHLYQ